MQIRILFRIFICICFAVFSTQLTAQEELDNDTKTKLRQRGKLLQQATELAKQGQFADAIRQFEETYKLEESIFGDSHFVLLRTLNSLCQIAAATQDADALIGYRERQRVISDKLYGGDDYRTQDAVRAVADAKQRATLTPEQKAKLAQADALNSQMVKSLQQGHNSDDIRAAIECVAIRKQVLGDQHPDYSAGLINLAMLYKAEGDYAKAEPLFHAAISIDERVLGKQHPDYATSLNNLAGMYDEMRNPKAEPLYLESMRIRVETLGKEHPDYINSLENLGFLYKQRGYYQRAEPLLVEAIAIRRQIFGKEHASYAESLNNLAKLYQLMSKYSLAEQYYRESMLLVAKLQGKEHPRYASSLNNLAGLYQSKGDYAKAEPLLHEVMAIRQKLFGKEHAYYAESLSDLGDLYQLMCNWTLAERHYRESMALVEKLQGKDHANYAYILKNLASLYKSMNDYERAKPLYCEVLAIREKVLGKEHRGYASSLGDLADCYKLMGDFAKAEPLYREELATVDKVFGKAHPNYAFSLNNLAELYRVSGNCSLAEPLYHESRTIVEKVLGKEHPDYASGLNNIALLYLEMHDHQRAEPLFREALVIREKVLGKEHPHYASSVNNLAGLYYLMGKFKQAEPLYVESLTIQEKVLGKEHPNYASSLSNLADLYESIGDYLRAEPLYQESRAIRERVQGKEHPDYAISLNNLAYLYTSMGDYLRAEPLYREAMEIEKVVLGEQHRSNATILGNLATLYNSIGDYARAEPLCREAVEITLANLELTADVQSQRQQVAMGESLRHRLDSYLSLAISEPKFRRAAYAALLRWKGSVWQRQVRQRSLVDQPSLQPRFEALQAVSSRLSTLILRVPDPNQRDAWRRQLDELTDQREKLERDLSLASVAFRQASTPVTPQQLRVSLPGRTILVDFLEYWHFTPANLAQKTKKSWERRLLVHLVSADGELRAIDCGDVDSLTMLVQTWRQDYGQGPASIDAASELKKRIWQPLEEHLDGISTVYVSPDGILGQFPLAVLPGKRPGSYLIEDLAIVMLPVPQGLPAMASSPPLASTNDRFCLVGGVDYEQAAAPATPSTTTGSMMLAVRGDQWQTFIALPGTETEINEIESLIRIHRPATQATTLRGVAASESQFASIAAGHRFLHVASHGFFAPEEVQNAMTAIAPDRMMTIGESSSPKLIGQHPDLLSGLVFAGANRKPDSDTEDDGILTAAEVQSLDLRKVDLAVLSACETGLGSTAGGEGIIGLQRAFQLAGARTTVTSLWKVDDAATQALMVEFYRNLFEKKLSKLESLRQAQLWLLNNPKAIEGRDLTTRGTEQKLKPLSPDAPKVNPTRSLPAYWAAFQLSGDPR